MKRKLTALILAFAMLACLSSAAAAQEAAPTVDQILNEYHQKAFEKQMQGEAAAVSTWSRSGSEQKTLEQETVDALTAAGYEAYNVTAANYDALEAELNTDFVDMGLDPNGSYIIVIEAEADVENVSANAGNNSRASPETDLEGPDHPGTVPTTYTYDGVTYNLKHVTVTSASDSDLHIQSSYTLAQKWYWPSSWDDIDDCSLVAVCNGEFYTSSATVVSLIAEINEICNHEQLDPENIVVNVDTSWTRRYIQVYNEVTNIWETWQFSERAVTNGYLSYFVENGSTTTKMEVRSGSLYQNSYSLDYLDENDRALSAVRSFLYSSIPSRDKAVVTFYLEDNDQVINSNSIRLFSHETSNN